MCKCQRADVTSVRAAAAMRSLMYSQMAHSLIALVTQITAERLFSCKHKHLNGLDKVKTANVLYLPVCDRLCMLSSAEVVNFLPQ